MSKITFSKPFFDQLKKLTTITKAGRALLYKKKGRYRLTISNDEMMIHLSAGPDDLYFDDDTVNIFSLSEFVKYAETTGYPESGSIEVGPELSATGRSYLYIKFISAKNLVCRSITADPTCFTKADRRTPHKRGEDGMERLAEICFTDESLKEFENRMRLVNGCRFFSIIIQDGVVRIYLKGKLAQQITFDVDSKSTRNVDDVLVKSVFTPGKIALFPSNWIKVMKGIGGTFEVDIKYARADGYEQMGVKAYQNIVGANPEDPIQIFCGASECGSDGTNNVTYDLVL